MGSLQLLRMRFSWLTSLVLLSLAIQIPVVTKAEATSPTVVAPRQPTFSLNTANQDPGDFTLSGFDGAATLLISVGFVDPPAGTTFSLPSTAGLTRGYGYDNWTNLTQISFTGTQANANTALGAMTVSTGSTTGNITIRVTATTNAANVYFNPINNSFYEYVSTGSTASNVFANAAGKTRYGVRGYLVTITSSQENSFVSTNINASNIWIGASDSAEEGTWKWGDGPESGQQFWSGVSSGSTVSGRYANWCSSGEPNDWGSGEDYAVTNWGDGTCWNDYGPPASAGASLGYVVEYSQNWGSVGSFTGIASAEITSLVSNAPRNVSAARATPAMSGELQVSWQSPLGVTPTSYTATSSPGSKTCTTSSLNCTVTGLTDGTSYTFTVIATFADNSTSTSLASAAVSPASTPVAITYDSQGGSSITSGSSIVGGTVASSPGAPSREFHSFRGWFTGTSGGSAITFPYTHGQTENFTLYAQWTDTRKTQSISLSGSTLDRGSNTTLSASGYSGTGEVTYSVSSGDCTIRGTVLTANGGSGTCAVNASVAADSTYQGASTSATFTLRTRQSQTITLSQLVSVGINSTPQSFTATSSSGLATSVFSSTPNTCSVSSGAVRALARGTCTVVASQGGNANFLPAPDISQSFEIIGLSQAITFSQPSSLTTVSDDQRLIGTSNSGLSVIFRTTTPSICTVQNGAIAPVAAGNCVVVASQAGDGTYSPAEEISRTVVIAFVAKSPQSLTISPVSAMTLDDLPQQISIVTKTATAVQVVASPSNVCAIDVQQRIKAIGEGVCTVRAFQPSTRQLEEAEAKVSLTVFRRASISERLVALEWTRPSSIDTKTPLGKEQLNARASIPGRFSYSPAAGSLLPGGINDLNLIFTPDDLANYLPVKLSVKILVRRAEAPSASPSPISTPNPSLSPTPTFVPTPSSSSTPTPSSSISAAQTITRKPTAEPTSARTSSPTMAIRPTPTTTFSPLTSQSVSPASIIAPNISAETKVKSSIVKIEVENVKPGSRVKVTVRRNVKP